MSHKVTRVKITSSEDLTPVARISKSVTLRFVNGIYRKTVSGVQHMPQIEFFGYETNLDTAVEEMELNGWDRHQDVVIRQESNAHPSIIHIVFKKHL